MVRLRQYVVGVILTLAALFAVGRIDFEGLDPNNTSIGLFLLVTLVITLVIATPSVARVSPAALPAATVLSFLLAKTWTHDAQANLYSSYMYVTATEMVLIASGVWLAQQITRRMNEFEDAVANITVGEMSRVKTIDSVSEDITIEMSRARRHERPLTVTVLTVDPDAMQGSLHQVVQAVQRSMLERYVLSGIARLAAQKSRRGDIIVQDQTNNRVIILSPEASPEQIKVLAGRLRSTAYRSLGLPIQFGCAGFPEQALTFDDLVEQATLQARRSSGEAVDSVAAGQLRAKRGKDRLGASGTVDEDNESTLGTYASSLRDTSDAEQSFPLD